MDLALKWFIGTIFVLFVLYMVAKTMFYKSVAQREERSAAAMKLTLEETQILIQKHQLQLQRALGNADILTQQLNELRNEIKALKQRNSQYRVETDKYRTRIKDLEQKIEALL
ncbi:hypothetical protein BKN38_04980 [Helicobacter sp. CLO-3]|uniref:hypothetical protein n=1 Tax=unclassified Helicobacter TaxID=2593540 RepID=UPI00080531EA|nr:MULTISPECIES: hypothetical protein [unclassified Helicobacter]OBV29878.1 hypothetical protein BA723_03745 [Helicobacter sp. CLO-3]OHU83682.1 hypothetical protein BKN38_04980 [Helicobacter sp. CLO-3]